MSCTALLFLLAPNTVASVYLDTGNPANIETALQVVSFLGDAAIFQLFDGLQATALGALRGLKDTAIPMMLCFVAYWLIGIPTGVGFGFGLEWGPEGLWWGLVVGLLAAAVMLTYRFFHMMRVQQLT